MYLGTSGHYACNRLGLLPPLRLSVFLALWLSALAGTIAAQNPEPEIEKPARNLKTGDEIYKQAKQIQPALPIVIITGYPDSQMLDNILKLGPVTVLKKPLLVETLQQTLTMLGHKLSEKQQAA